MSHLPWVKFYPRDWLADPAVQAASPEARGAWINLLCRMWSADPISGSVVGTHLQLRRVAGVDPDQWAGILEEWQRLEIATVTVRLPDVTVTCRRLSREHKAREQGRLRQQRYRKEHGGNGPVPGEISDIRGQTPLPPDESGGGSSLSPLQRDLERGAAQAAQAKARREASDG